MTIDPAMHLIAAWHGLPPDVLMRRMHLHPPPLRVHWPDALHHAEEVDDDDDYAYRSMFAITDRQHTADEGTMYVNNAVVDDPAQSARTERDCWRDFHEIHTENEELHAQQREQDLINLAWDLFDVRGGTYRDPSRDEHYPGDYFHDMASLSNDLHGAPLLDQYEAFRDDFEADPDATSVHEHDHGYAFGDEEDSEHDDRDDVSEDERSDDDETYDNRGAWDRRH